MFLTDLIKIPSKRKYTDSGMLIVPCAFARTGTQLYTADSLGLEGGNKIIEVHRTEDQVFDSESMESFRSIPVTDKHPTNKGGDPISVTSKNSKDLQVGSLEGVPTRDEDLLTGTLIISDQEAINTVEEGTVELSAGYTCDVIEKDGKYYQTNIRANHIAIVERGRAGSSCRLSDEELKLDEGEIMADKKENEVTVDSLTVDLELMQAKLDIADAKVDAAEVKITKLTADAEVKDQELLATIDSAVLELTGVVSLAKDLTDLKDFAGKSVREIKAMIVADKLSIDLTDKSEEYVQARLDILVEDAGKETPMGEAMKPAVKEIKVEDKVVNTVDAARQRMIDRNSHKGEK